MRCTRRLVRHAAAERPDVLVAIDFPDFNFRLAKAVRNLGVPVVYYISPQLWAWRPGRISTLKAIADRVLVIFPFEVDIYRKADVPVQWVGHPLLDVMPPTRSRSTFFAGVGMDPARPTVALLPGSRPNELRAILPSLVEAAALIRQRLPTVQFVLARAPHLPGALLHPVAQFNAALPAGDRIAIVEDATDDVLATVDLAIVASGTVTVQAALHECPMVVVYRVSPVTYRLGRRFVHVDTFAMANLVAGRTVVPELMQDDFTPTRVAEAALAILLDPEARARVRSDLRAVRDRLGTPGASRRAALAVLDVARGSNPGSHAVRG